MRTRQGQISKSKVDSKPIESTRTSAKNTPKGKKGKEVAGKKNVTKSKVEGKKIPAKRTGTNANSEPEISDIEESVDQVNEPVASGSRNKKAATNKKVATNKRGPSSRLSTCTLDCRPGVPGNLSDCPNALVKYEKLPKNFKTCHEVHDILKKMGIRNPLMVTPCVKSAIRRGHLKVTGKSADLEKVVCKGETCLNHQATGRLKDILYQASNGWDYETGEGATLICQECAAGKDTDYPERLYVAELCLGDPAFSDGKFYNHCEHCAGFGQCVGDYRSTHCTACNEHGHRGCVNPECKLSKENEYLMF